MKKRQPPRKQRAQRKKPSKRIFRAEVAEHAERISKIFKLPISGLKSSIFHFFPGERGGLWSRKKS